MSAPKERPILFSGWKVRAILAGLGTQTRRVVRPAPTKFDDALQPGDWWPHGKRTTNLLHPGAWKACPYGQPGDRLWVRETFVLEWPEMDRPEDEGEFRRWVVPHYAATESKPDLVDQNTERPIGWRPSIFMPRWASRLTLDLTQVRVERLQDISEEDAKAEGCGLPPDGRAGVGIVSATATARDNFALLWNDLNTKRGFGWDTNPWVWVLTFKRTEAKAVAA